MIPTLEQSLIAFALVCSTFTKIPCVLYFLKVLTAKQFMLAFALFFQKIRTSKRFMIAFAFDLFCISKGCLPWNNL